MRFLVTLIGLTAAFAQTQPKAVDWQTATNLPQIDLSGLTPVQKKAVLKALRAEACLCGCGMQIAECRVKDPSCSDSRALADIVIRAVRDGKDPQQALTNSDMVRMKVASTKLLEAAVALSTKGAPAKGPANARITLVEFSDFECPYCTKAAAKVEAILRAYPNDARLVYKQYPLPSHPNARMAAEAALAAQAQDKFWPLHDKLFANSSRLSAGAIIDLAQGIGIDMARFRADLESHRFQPALDKDIADGDRAQVSGTPTIFINGKRYNGPLELVVLKPILDAELKIKK